MPAEAASAKIVTKAPPWHGWVTADLFLSSLGAGTFAVAAICLLVRPDEFAPAARIAFLIVFPVMLADLACLVIDLGDPARFHHMLRVFKPGSPMSVGVWTLSVFSFIAFIAFAATILRCSISILEASAAVGLIPALIAGTYKGVLFSTTAQPGWSRMRWLGATLSVSSATMGLALMVVLTEAFGRVSQTLRDPFWATLFVLLVAFAATLKEVNIKEVVRQRWFVALSLTLLLPFVTLTGTAFLDQITAAIVMIHAIMFRHLIVVIPHRVGRRPAK